MANVIEVDKVGGVLLLNGEPVMEAVEGVPPSILDAFMRELGAALEAADEKEDWYE